MSIANKLLQVNQVKQDIKTAIETKGIPMTNVAFTEYANKILEISSWDISYEEYALALYYRFGKLALFENAWEHSLTVDPLEISAKSSFESQRGKAQYPNGETEGVIIPQGVKEIGINAFYGWKANNQPLVIPNSVTSIGYNAFTGWKENNQPLVIPNSVTSIGFDAFSDWKSNNHPLIIPNGVQSIRSSSFSSWTSNNHPLTIPSSVTSIDHYAFSDWTTNDQPLTIPNSVVSIGRQAFYGWKANNQPLIIPDSVLSIDERAFEYWVKVPYIEMKGTTPPTLTNANAFGSQNNAPIYVPDESVDDYKTATNWVDLADRIFPISSRE